MIPQVEIGRSHDPAGVWAKDLWYVVDSVKANFGITDTTHDKTFFKWAMDIYRDLTLANILREAVRTWYIPVPPKYQDLLGEPEGQPHPWPNLGPPQADPDNNNRKLVQFRFQMPVDFIDYYTIGILCGDYVQPLDYNDNILTLDIPVNDCCGDELAENFKRDRLCSCGGGFGEGGFQGVGGISAYYDWGFGAFWKNGQFVAGQYGRSAYRYRGAFTLDWQTREIVLDAHTHPQHGLVIVGKSNGIGTGNCNVTDNMVPAMVAGVEWKKAYYETQTKQARDRGKIDLALVQTAKHEYRVEMKRANARRHAMTAQEFHNVVLKSIRQTPKR